MSESIVADQELELLRDAPDRAVAELMTKYQDPLLRMVSFRLDRRLFGRVDPADVLQDAYLEVSKRIHEYTADPQVSFFVWARQITWQTLLKTNRRHLEVKKRDAKREERNAVANDDTSVALAARLLANVRTPSGEAVHDETIFELHKALMTMNEVDREVLALRHFEQLSNQETAEVLGIQKSAASNRYIRALARLKEIMNAVVGHE